MGKRYNASHFSEAQVRESWESYSKWEYYYKTEIAKAEEGLAGVESSARARLTAQGYKEGDSEYQREMDRVMGAANSSLNALRQGQKDFESGAISEILMSPYIHKEIGGGYHGYISPIEDAFTEAVSTKAFNVNSAEQYQEGYMGTTIYTGGYAPSSGYGPSVSTPGDPPNFEQMRLDVEVASKNLAEAMTMSEYYTKMFGAYDPQIDQAEVARKESSKKARAVAGGRSFKEPLARTGGPGGGKTGNVFLETPEVSEAAQDSEVERDKAWWM